MTNSKRPEAKSLFGEVSEEASALAVLDLALIREYLRIGVPVDHLPYTEQFDSLYEGVEAERGDMTQNAVFLRLASLRKRGQLPRLVRNQS